MLEDKIMAVSRLFAAEITKIEAKKPGTRLRLDLSVRYVGYRNDGEPKMELLAHFEVDNNYQDVKASSIGKLMDEVYRRIDFDDRDQAAREANNASLVALPSPLAKELDDEIPF